MAIARAFGTYVKETDMILMDQPGSCADIGSGDIIIDKSTGLKYLLGKKFKGHTREGAWYKSDGVVEETTEDEENACDLCWNADDCTSRREVLRFENRYKSKWLKITLNGYFPSVIYMSGGPDTDGFDVFTVCFTPTAVYEHESPVIASSPAFLFYGDLILCDVQEHLYCRVPLSFELAVLSGFFEKMGYPCTVELLDDSFDPSSVMCRYEKGI